MESRDPGDGVRIGVELVREVIRYLLQLSDPALFDESRKHSLNFAAAQWEMAACLLAIEQSRAYSNAGFSSVCQYAEVRLGISAHTAAEMLRVARVLLEFPLLSEAVREGSVNWTKAREITRVATPDSEAGWVKFARNHTTREVERKIVKSPRQWKRDQRKAPGAEAGGGAGPGNSQGNDQRQGTAGAGGRGEPGCADGLHREEHQGTAVPTGRETRGSGSNNAADQRPDQRPDSRGVPPGEGSQGGGTYPAGGHDTSPDVEERDLFGDLDLGPLHEQTDPKPTSTPTGEAPAQAGRQSNGQPSPASAPATGAGEGGGVGEAREEQPSPASASSTGAGEGGGVGEAREEQPSPASTSATGAGEGGGVGEGLGEQRTPTGGADSEDDGQDWAAARAWRMARTDSSSPACAEERQRGSP